MDDQLNTSYETKVQAELIGTLYQQAHTALIGVIATSTGIAILFYNRIPHVLIFIWLFAIYTLSFIRLISIKQFKKQNIEPEETLIWGWKFSFFTFLSGVSWGAASLLFFTPENLQLFNVLTLIVIAMSMGSLAALSAFPWAYYSFVVPAMSPMVYQYLNIDNQDYHIFGILLFVFIFALFSFSRVNYRMLRQSVELRFSNMGLIKQLTEQKEKAELANISKTKFLAAASHDLRQPLHAIGLFLGSLLNKVEKDDQKVIVQKIQKSSAALNSLLDSLLDVSKLDAGVITVDPAPFKVNSLFESLKNEFETNAREKNLSLKFVETRLTVNTDFRILERIMRNLLSNAIRYTESGGILIGCRRVQGKILIAVYDTGLGIEKDKLNDIFNEFYQVDNPERDRSKGLGLGLAIVKRMTELLGLSLITVSAPGKGSMFGIEISACSANNLIETKKNNVISPQIFKNKRVLVVDDEADIRESLAELLDSWYCEVLLAASGEEALEVSKNNRPDIILVDYRLRNNETGNDVINKVQALFPDEKIPAIIITGDTAPERIKEAHASGYEIIHKPVAPDELQGLISRNL